MLSDIAVLGLDVKSPADHSPLDVRVAAKE